MGNTESMALQNVDYTYNIRGWLKDINDVNDIGTDLFSFALNYDQVTGGTALFNGNISATSWKTANTDSSLKKYNYKYDGLNRISTAIDSRNDTIANQFGLVVSGYDKNGNIKGLFRLGHIVESPDINISTDFGGMDNLLYRYDDGNKLLSVNELAGGDANYGFKDGNTTDDDYDYDLNGNLTSDANKGITDILYNHLNLPTEVQFGATNKIEYFNDASGMKLSKKVTEGSSLTTTNYAGNFIYEDNGFTEELKFFNQPEGYVEPTGDVNKPFQYVYQYKDHLGNIRLSYSDSDDDGSITASTEIIEENNYYPFGLKHKGYNNTIVSEHPYKYNGKELNEELGLDWYDYGARNYEASLGKWMNVDPLADKYYDLSTYNYTANNPILFTDPNGAHIDISGLNDVQKKAFGKFLNTNQGKRFLKLYGSANQVVLGHEVGPTGGKFSYHSVYFYSHDNQSFTKGKGGKTRTRFLSRKSKDYIGFHQVSETNITRNLLFQVQIGTKENEIESTVTIGHEVLVHVENITNSFENIVNDYNDGALSKEAKKRRISKNQLLKEKISGIIGAKKDHKLFVNGENVNYEEFIKELGSLFKRKSDSDKKNTKEYEKL